jgi:hypothetical protein
VLERSNDSSISVLLTYGYIVDAFIEIGGRDCSRWKIDTYCCLSDGNVSKCGHCRMDSVVDVCMDSRTAFCRFCELLGDEPGVL